MKKTSKTALFFGSGPVAAASLEKLLAHPELTIEAVITKPTPPHHRGTAPVIELCKTHKLSCFTPTNKAELSELFKQHHFASSVGIVIDYGIIIAAEVIDEFPYGIINSHFSLLPKWRGADPITFSILSGQKETGVSLMRIVAAMDEGPLLAQDTLRIQPDETVETLTQKLIQLSDDMLRRYMPEYLNDAIEPIKQVGKPSYSRKLQKQDGMIDWSKPADVLEREVRAFHAWPKSTARIGDYTVIVRQAALVDLSNYIDLGEAHPGAYVIDKKTLVVRCGDDSALQILRIQPPNKKEMPVEAFLAGYQL